VLHERDRLIQLTRSVVTPPPEVEVRQYNVDGKTILVLSVGPGADVPYGITPGNKDRPAEFYVRRGATTFPARPEEIPELGTRESPPRAALDHRGWLTQRAGLLVSQQHGTSAQWLCRITVGLGVSRIKEAGR
jgi:hypothetical protein